MEWPDGCDPITLTTKFDGLVHGRNLKTKDGIAFTVRELLYADDAGILFNSRLDMQAGLDALVTHLSLFGLECHYSPEGTPPDDSKSQCVFFPAPNATVTVADEQPITISAHDVENRTFPA